MDKKRIIKSITKETKNFVFLKKQIEFAKKYSVATFNKILFILRYLNWKYKYKRILPKLT